MEPSHGYERNTTEGNARASPKIEAAHVAAEIQAAEQDEEVPHFDQIERPAHELGKRFSRDIQGQLARDVWLATLPSRISDAFNAPSQTTKAGRGISVSLEVELCP
ncbi:hypothetical protein [Novipirellula aureliae]|uniref:hypothetical protein n=1 Tax=Novipirellula aureliae TaxID=2527966 RepID=UPI0011B663E3|nr:hypothetical protein [Novipirellula aureliae]